jgi:exodeoxyribonuclease VII small subunit
MNEGQASEPYETIYNRLQAIVARLESGDLALDQALALYEEGTQLATTCQRLLDNAELRIREIATTVDEAVDD